MGRLVNNYNLLSIVSVVDTNINQFYNGYCYITTSMDFYLCVTFVTHKNKNPFSTRKEEKILSLVDVHHTCRNVVLLHHYEAKRHGRCNLACDWGEPERAPH